MQTDTLKAHEIENNDWLVQDGEPVGYVYSMDDHGDWLVFDVVDEDGNHDLWHRQPFEDVEIVVSFDDEGEDDE